MDNFRSGHVPADKIEVILNGCADGAMVSNFEQEICELSLNSGQVHYISLLCKYL